MPSVASADLDEAQRLFREEANFVGALAALDAAAAGDDLSRAELVELLVLRAVIHAALHDDAERDRALTMLRTLEPEHAFAAWVPPSVRQRFGELQPGTPAAIDAQLVTDGDSARLVAWAEGDLVGGTRIHWRSGEGEWSSVDATAAEVPRGPVAFYAEALGPGGAVIASAGTRDAPLHGGLAPSDAITSLPEQPAPSDDDWVVPTVITGVAVVVVAAVAILVAVLVPQPQPATILDPEVRW